jgi:hypothetical protein
MWIAVVALLASFGLDVVAHAFDLDPVEPIAHLAGLLSMVALLVVIVVRGMTAPQGEDHAVR